MNIAEISFISILGVMAAFYFIFIRPARQEQKVHETTIREIGDAINRQYADSTDRVEQAWVLLFLPPTAEARELYRPVYELAQQNKDALVRVVHLYSTVTKPNDRQITDAQAETDPMIVEYADALKARLERELEERRKARKAKRR